MLIVCASGGYGQRNTKIDAVLFDRAQRAATVDIRMAMFVRLLNTCVVQPTISAQGYVRRCAHTDLLTYHTAFKASGKHDSRMQLADVGMRAFGRNVFECHINRLLLSEVIAQAIAFHAVIQPL
jgi:hypothetical protein